MKKIFIFMCIMIFSFIVAACGKKETVQSDYNVYYMNKECTDIVSVPYEPSCDREDTIEMIEEFIELIKTGPDSVEYNGICPDGVSIEKYQYEDNGQLYLHFTKDYYAIEKSVEVLCRAAIVATFTQIQGVDSVGFFVQDSQLTDKDGNAVGFMKNDNFAADTGENINSITSSEITLYFSNKDGTKLEKEQQKVHYSNTISMEKLVVEQLIAGPKSDNLKAVIPEDVKLIGISVKDGICYVNFDKTFLTKNLEIDDHVVIYAIVNSLSELPDVNKVQISVDSETNVMFMETVSLEQIFSRNLDIILTTKSRQR